MQGEVAVELTGFAGQDAAQHGARAKSLLERVCAWNGRGVSAFPLPQLATEPDRSATMRSRGSEDAHARLVTETHAAVKERAIEGEVFKRRHGLHAATAAKGFNGAG